MKDKIPIIVDISYVLNSQAQPLIFTEKNRAIGLNEIYRFTGCNCPYR